MRETISRRAALRAGVGGCLFLAAAYARPGLSGNLPTFLDSLHYGAIHGFVWGLVLVEIAGTALALYFLRWWPYVLAVAGLLLLVRSVMPFFPLPGVIDLVVVTEAAPALALVGVLACAQSLIRRGATGTGATVAGLAIGARVMGTAMTGPGEFSFGPSL